MDLEKLNKSQIVLLTLLVSFVTSIATGIVAVTLMQQAPPAITQTVNRIVERTVERVVPQVQIASAAATPAPAPAPVTEKTVVIHQSDQITEAVGKTMPMVVRLFSKGTDEQGYSVELFLGLGVVAASDGLIFADASMMSDGAAISVLRNDGVRVLAHVVGRDKTSGIVRLQAATTTTDAPNSTDFKPVAWTPASFVKSSANLGETVITFAGRSSLKIASGIVTSLSGENNLYVETSIPTDSITAGSPLITANGEVLGIATNGSKAAAAGAFLAASGVLSYNTASETTPESTSH